MKYTLVAYYYKTDFDKDFKDQKSLCLDEYHPDLGCKILRGVLDGNIKNPETTVPVMHSCHPMMLNTFGKYIYDKKIDPQDIEIILYRDDHSRAVLHFDEKGYIIDWPYGFFEPSMW
jgi:hypothetical protein